MKRTNRIKFFMIPAFLLALFRLSACDQAEEGKAHPNETYSGEEQKAAHDLTIKEKLESLPPFESDPFATFSDGWIPADGIPAGTDLTFAKVDGERYAYFGDAPDVSRIKILAM